MLKKEEVYVVIEKQKNYEKFNKIVKMFNVDYTLDFYGDGGIAVFDNCFLPDTETKTKVSLKELRNILANEEQPKDTTSLDSLKDRLIGIEGTKDRDLYEYELIIDILHEVIQGLEKLKNK